MKGLHGLFERFRTNGKKQAAHDEISLLHEEDEGEIFTVSFSEVTPNIVDTTARLVRRERERKLMEHYELYSVDDEGNKVGRPRFVEYSSL